MPNSTVNSKERVKGEAAEPHDTLKLLDSIGVTKASKALGVSTTTLHKARNEGVVSKVIEVAAGAVLSDTPNIKMTPDERLLILIEAPKSRAAVVERVLKALNVEFTTA